MKNLSNFNDFDAVDLYAVVKITGPLHDNDFQDDFEQLWSPEEIDDFEWKVFVYDQAGYEQLIEFLNKAVGAHNYVIKLL